MISFILLSVFSTGCMKNPEGFSDNEDTENGDTNIEYPSQILPLSEIELQTLKAEFNTLKGDSVSAELDEYGLVDWAGVLVRGSSNITEADTAVSKAREILVRLDKFTNVNDSTLLEIKEATNEHGSGIYNDWIITFKNQMYSGLEVLNTEITVLVGDEVRQISGHHYTNIFIPEIDVVDMESAGQLLIGYQIEYICWTPGSYVITEGSINYNKIEKVIYPLHPDDRIEFRVVWKIPVGDNSIPDWYIYVDVMTGEIVLVGQTFIC